MRARLASRRRALLALRAARDGRTHSTPRAADASHSPGCSGLSLSCWCGLGAGHGARVRRRARGRRTGDRARHAGGRSGARPSDAIVVVGGLVAATHVVVLVLAGLSFAGQRRLFGPPDEAVTIRVTGHQWWWEIRYEEPGSVQHLHDRERDPRPGRAAGTIKLNSTDVIHSFWVPSLTASWTRSRAARTRSFTAERPGVYRGQCAEYCGLQHAHMGLLVVAETPGGVRRVAARRRSRGAPPEDDERRPGWRRSRPDPAPCATRSAGRMPAASVAPDLTHVGEPAASRPARCR